MERTPRFRDRQMKGRSPRVLVGGIGRRAHGDASAGLIAADRMAEENWPDGIEVTDLGESAVEAADRLARAKPPYDRLVLLSSCERGRAPGRVYSYRWSRRPAGQAATSGGLGDSSTSGIDIDELLATAERSGVLPGEVVIIELEPDNTSADDALSDRALRLLPEMTRRAQREALGPLKRQPAVSPSADPV